MNMAGNFLHGGATATLVDLVGSAVIYTLGAPLTGVSVEINASYLDAAFAGEEIEDEAKSFACWEGNRCCQCRVEEQNNWENRCSGASYQVPSCLQ